MSRGDRIVIVGDALCDRDLDGRVERMAADAPVPVVDDVGERSRPGGAGLAATIAAADGATVTLVTALGDDAAGEAVRAALAAAGVDVIDLGLDGPTPEKVRICSDGRTLLRLDRSRRQAFSLRRPRTAAIEAISEAATLLVADYGYGVPADGELRRALAATRMRTPIVWDPHPRGPAPIPGVRLATPNRGEAARLVPEVAGEGLTAEAERARRLARRWQAGGVCITLGARGALLASAVGPPHAIPAPAAVAASDPCGAGDRFAVRAAELLGAGAPLADAVAEAVAAATRFVASGGASGTVPPAMPGRGVDDAAAVVARVRAGGGVIVATGGCFDLLHAGHVALLRGARLLGDCLIVCLNGDESVRRLKGPERPLVPAHDRAEVLRALTAVDAVAVFDESTPERLLAELRPDVFVKGGDYEASDLPEARLLASWGGETVILPYVAGRSTTGLIAEAVGRGI
jgi:rfaE bifunctional protein nucleotidyltransferase chain/domain/rfaE bifunctional protein kinase chain/domain